jgi:flagellar biosynthesis protein FlgN
MTRSEQLVQLAGRDIEQDCADYQGLQRLMQALYQQLLVRDSAQIESLNEQISALLEFISTRAQRRSKILAAVNLSPAIPGAMEKLLSHCALPNRSDYLRAWSELETLVQATKQLNERNGNLLAMHNDILSQIMANTQSSPVYAPRYY